MNSTFWTIEISMNFTLIAFYALIMVVESPWIVYFISKVVETKKYLSFLNHYKNWTDSSKENIQQNKNKLHLYTYILLSTIFESLTVSSIILTLLLIFNIPSFEFDCTEYYFVVNLYFRYLAMLSSIVLPQCTFELINTTIIFVKDIFLRNMKSSGMTRKICMSLLRILISVLLGLSGFGLPFAFVFGEIFLIFGCVKYYKLSRKLYRALVIITEDMYHEYGQGSVEAIQARNQMLHYKRFTIWFFIYASVLVLISVDFVLWLPQSIMEEQCVLPVLLNVTTFEDNPIYQLPKNLIAVLGVILHIAGLFIFVPFYAIYSVYYLWDKLLYSRRHPHRYKVRYSVGIEEMLINNFN